MVTANLVLIILLKLLASSTTGSSEECDQDSNKENRDVCYITSVESGRRDDDVTGVSCPDGYSIVDCILVQVRSSTLAPEFQLAILGVPSKCMSQFKELKVQLRVAHLRGVADLKMVADLRLKIHYHLIIYLTDVPPGRGACFCRWCGSKYNEKEVYRTKKPKR